MPWSAAGLRSPFAALLPDPVSAEDSLGHLVREILPLDAARPPRVGLVVATASGAVTGPFERWLREGGEERPWRQWPTQRIAARYALAPATTLSVACASGTAAFHVARGWLRDSSCDAVIVAGVDVLSLFVHAGFAGLGALCRERPRVFAAERDGLLLGEGGAAFLLEPPGSPRSALAALRGAGLAQDGVHYTAPDRTGDGLYRAAALAVAESGIGAEALGSVSLHGTGTPFNDAMEARALSRLFGALPVPAHAPKLAVGHAMGAAGTVEAAALLAFVLGAPPPPPGPRRLRNRPRSHLPRRRPLGLGGVRRRGRRPRPRRALPRPVPCPPRTTSSPPSTRSWSSSSSSSRDRWSRRPSCATISTSTASMAQT